MEEILHQLIGSLSNYLQGFVHLRWLAGFLPSTVSSIQRFQKPFGRTTTSNVKCHIPNKKYLLPKNPTWLAMENPPWISRCISYETWGFSSQPCEFSGFFSSSNGPLFPLLLLTRSWNWYTNSTDVLRTPGFPVFQYGCLAFFSVG